jgi:hypothetical protein
MRPRIVSEILPFLPVFHLLYPLHHPLPQFLGLIADQLSLSTNEVALDLSEFLGFMNE